MPILFRPAPNESEQLRNTRWTRDTCLSIAAAGVVAIFIYALQWVPTGFVQVFGGSLMVAVAVFTAGVCLGFLFGIPRTLQGTALPPPATAGTAAAGATPAVPSADSETSPAHLGTNTNLEQISDWLTKIIVGLGLINLEKLPAKIRSIVSQIAPTVGGQYGFTLAIVLGYSICGFLLGYLLTRLYLTSAFTLVANDPLGQLGRTLASIGDQTARTFTGTGSGTDPVSPQLTAAAAQVKMLAQNVDSNQLRAQVQSLARTYESIRLTMTAGDLRTQKMEGVAGAMRALSDAAYSLLPELTRSASAGDRLAAISFLETKPSPDFLSWLADRVAQEEHPFMRYHAAWALARARFILPRDQQDAVSKAVDRALAEEKKKADDERDAGTIQTLEKARSSP
jgi:hypothetical protein